MDITGTVTGITCMLFHALGFRFTSARCSTKTSHRKSETNVSRYKVLATCSLFWTLLTNLICNLFILSTLNP